MNLKRNFTYFTATLALGLTCQTSFAADDDADYRALGTPATAEPSQTIDKDSLFANKNQDYYTQNEVEKVGAWVDGGIGYGGTVGTNGVAGVLGLNFRYADSYYSVFSSTVSSENTVYAPGLFTQWAYDKEHSRDVGFLYGSIGDLSAGYYTYGMGLAYAQGRTSDESTVYTTVGIPFQTQIVWTPSKHIGIGLKAFAALNGNIRQSDAGVAIELSLGKFA